VATWYRRRQQRRRLGGGLTGAVAVILRGSSGLRLNPHVHVSLPRRCLPGADGRWRAAVSSSARAHPKGARRRAPGGEDASPGLCSAPQTISSRRFPPRTTWVPTRGEDVEDGPARFRWPQRRSLDDANRVAVRSGSRGAYQGRTRDGRTLFRRGRRAAPDAATNSCSLNF
jgi:hypothetical protein